MNPWLSLALLILGAAMVFIGASLLFSRSEYFRSHSAHERGMHRFWWSFGRHNGWNHWLETSLEVVDWRRNKMAGFKFHVGDRGSETPFDGYIGLWFISFYWGLGADWLRSFAQWLGRGHKRNFSLRFFGGSMWWELWYDDDMGYDDWHKCDKWRKPKLWPWSMGRTKYRSWMCLREGSIDLNPLDAFWGSRKYHYETLEEDTLLIEIHQFPGDEYMVDFKLQKVVRYREYGPKWARRRQFVYYSAEWFINEEDEGIPTQNHDWKGNNTLGSSVKIEDHIYWRMEADIKLVAWVKEEREKRGYRPPASTPISDQVDAMTLNLVGLADHKSRYKDIKEDLEFFGEDGQPAIEKFTELDARLNRPDMIIATGDETYAADFKLAENEELKGMYTPEELAQQAINRDKEDK